MNKKLISPKKKTKISRKHRTKNKNNYQRRKDLRELAKMDKKHMQKINIENINYFPVEVSEERKPIKSDHNWTVHRIIPRIFSKIIIIYYKIPYWIVHRIIPWVFSKIIIIYYKIPWRDFLDNIKYNLLFNFSHFFYNLLSRSYAVEALFN